MKTYAFLPCVALGLMCFFLSGLSSGSPLVERYDAKQITAGESHTCVILKNDKVKCWGDNRLGQLGYDDYVPKKKPPTQFASNGIRAKHISAGKKHTCVILKNDKVKCWGSNGNFQLGYGGIRRPSKYVGSGMKAKQIITSSDYSCAVMKNDKVKCWGRNRFGQLGYKGPADYFQKPPAEFASNGIKVKQITAGESHTCAILKNDKVKCWGDNQLGQLGYGSSRARLFVGNGMKAKQITAGESHTCAILKNDKVKCWGHNLFGQLGYGYRDGLYFYNGNIIPRPYIFIHGKPPAEFVGNGMKAKQITAGKSHTCAILKNDKVKCWGANNAGQLGYGDTVQRKKVPAEFVGNGMKAKQITAGKSHTCAILKNDKVKCWGDNSLGQLGYGETVQRKKPPTQFVDLGKERIVCRASSDCTGGRSCQKGVCKCLPRKTFCGTRCVDIKSNSKHCGTCGTVCAKGHICQDGTCSYHKGGLRSISHLKGRSKSGQMCSGKYVDLNTNNNHCGRCGKICPNSLSVSWLIGTQSSARVLRALGVDRSENTYVTGFYDNTMSFGTIPTPNVSSGMLNGYIAKASPQGKWLWVAALRPEKHRMIIFSASATDNSGNSYVLGNGSISNRVFSGTTSQVVGNFVAKINPHGKWLWFREPDRGPSYKKIMVDRLGNYYLTGVKSSTKVGRSGKDCVVRKNGPQGKYLWENWISTCHYIHMAKDGSGNIYVAGGFTGKASFGETNLTAGKGNTRIFVAKLDSQGKWLWAQKIGNSSVRVDSYTVDKSGNSFLLGSFLRGPWSFGKNTLTSTVNQYSSSFIGKIDRQGKPQWATQFIGSYIYRYSHSIIAGDDGYAYFTNAMSRATAYRANIPNLTNKSEIVVGRIDANGKLSWVNKTGIYRNASLPGIVWSDNGLYLAGESGVATFGNVSINSGIYIMKLEHAKSCSLGVCCNIGHTNCGGFCKNLISDSSNCGTCGTLCTRGKNCQNGVCK